MSHLLEIALPPAVHLRIAEYLRKGGPTDTDYGKAREVGPLLGEKGDILLYKSKVKGESADIFNKVADAIAVMSFIPGGVTLFGSHFETKLEKS